MRSIKTLSLFLAIGIFMMACSQNQPTQVANTAPAPRDANLADVSSAEMDSMLADNFDLQRVGNLLERSKTPQEFERYLNEDDGINNLDFNGDGYADYISVDEYGGPDDYERGLSLYSRFGDDRQEIAYVNFYRDEPRYPGARILVTGNDNIYGDNYYYETNWLEKTLSIVSLLFQPRREYYRSPYYYDHYPSDYVVYDVVDTPYYRTRMVDLYPEPLFVYTAAPTFISKIKIKSPNNGLHLGQIYGKLKKPTKEQAEFIKNNPRKPGRVKDDKGRERGNNGGKDDKGRGRDDAPGQSGRDDKGKGGDKGGPGKSGKDDNPGGGPSMKGPDKGKGGDKGNGGDKGKGKGKGKG